LEPTSDNPRPGRAPDGPGVTANLRTPFRARPDHSLGRSTTFFQPRDHSRPPAADDGPRDVVAAYRVALEARKDVVPAGRALIEEGRLLVLELMGHLVSYYRRNAVSAAAASPPLAGRREEYGHE
jgi:hypothetical protein